MNFGERLKQLRQERAWSQPELAAAIGIEQSYLSKLENEKSAPSPEMLDRILAAFALDLDSFLSGIDVEEIRNQLKSIPLVQTHLLAQQEQARRQRVSWTVGSALCCVIGLGLMPVGVGLAGKLVETYDYESVEIVPNGANGESYLTLQAFLQHEFIDTQVEIFTREDNPTRREQELSHAFDLLRYRYASLQTPATRMSQTYRGSSYIAAANSEQDLVNLQAVGQESGGTRQFGLVNTRSELPAAWFFVNASAVFLLFLGIFGFVVERRLYPKQA